ncbi:MFS transporter [Sulfobacillus sp. DSM 109850]|uniref:MFS transporter n=2 Tax=Sulfobacillus harzensis TaxID=2729629 RepID=A0A7Y0Q2U6_9FIRM|nr:MFS transporter [Sulfobacillus harzensis]
MTRDLWWMTLAQGLWGLGFGLYGLLFPLYIEKLGGGPVIVGLMSTVSGIITAFVVFPGGWLSDRVDRRTVLIWGSIVAVPVPFLFAMAPHWEWLIVGVVLYFGSAFSVPTTQAVVVSEASPNKLSTAYNVVMSVFGAGMVIGPTIGGYLTSHYSYQLVFILAGILYALSTLAMAQIQPHPPVPIQKTHQVEWRPKTRPRYFQWVIFSAGLATVQGIAWPFVVPYWKTVGHLSIETIGVLGSIAILAATVTGPIWGRVGEKLGIPRALGAGLGLLVVGWMALLWAPESIGWGLFSGLMRGVGEGSRGLQGVAVGRVARPGEIGTAYGFYNLVTELAGALAPLPGGLLFRNWAYAPLVIATFFTAIIAWWLWNGLPGRPTPAPPITP